MKPRNIVICGGGTGGHLYPSLMVGRALKAKSPDLELVYIGGRRDVERQIMERQGVRFISLAVEGLVGRGWKSLRAALLLPAAFLKSVYLLAVLRPALVIGMGGYSSGPVVLPAVWLGRPTVILEQNVRPGFTNRMLQRFVDRAVTSFAESLPFFGDKGVFIGNPVRDEFFNLPVRREKREIPAVLIFGGSQGSHFLNRTATAALPLFQNSGRRIRIIHQTGSSDLDTTRAAYTEQGFENARVEAYLWDMPAAFDEADCVVCRAGATSVAELIAARKPSILVPFAGAAENHQEHNARVLEKAGGAEVLLEKDSTPEALAGKILDLLEDRQKLAAMQRSLESLRRKDAAGHIADLCLKLIDQNRPGGEQ